jgi:hypothetical protein
MTRDRAVRGAIAWTHFEGAGLDWRHRQAGLRALNQPGKRAMLKIKHARTAD